MSFNYNHVTLVGRVAQNVKQEIVNDVYKTSFTLVVDRPYYKEDGSKESDYCPVVMYGKLAEVAEKYLKKARPVLVEGRIQRRETEKNKFSGLEIIAENFQLLERISE